MTDSLKAKVEKAYERIEQAYEIAEKAGNALVVAYSGGKDSDVLLRLAIDSGVPFSVEHNHTTVDAPETVYHIREVFAGLSERGISALVNEPPEIENVDGRRVRASMWNLIPKKGIPPTRLARYCCQYFKERRFDGQ
ncbi:MAG: phosphoadenosine phosphosulfate reductase family protein, partial [Oscillospiraceae bacterium]|nr:phosphoadenosine phosphosulfate reductase family protein [Oscillospiraceae bacterium]